MNRRAKNGKRRVHSIHVRFCKAFCVRKHAAHMVPNDCALKWGFVSVRSTLLHAPFGVAKKFPAPRGQITFDYL